MLSPPNLAQAMNLAPAYEKKQQLTTSLRRSYGTSIGMSSKTNNIGSIANSKINSGQGNFTAANSSTNSVNSLFIMRLSRVKMAERRAKGLCYNCDEQYEPRHQCKKLFLLEISEKKP